MEKIEKFLVVIMILTVISIVSQYFSNFLLIKLYGPELVGKINVFSRLIAYTMAFFRSLVHICVAVWLFAMARENKKQPWAWFVFGFFFGLMAVILFYLTQVCDMVRGRLEISGNSNIS